MELRAELEHEEDGRWIADIPSLPGVMAYGATAEEALRSVKILALVASPLKDPRAVRARRVISVLGVERWSQPGSELARVLGRSPDVVSWWVGEGVRQRLGDPDFARRLDDIDESLSKATSVGPTSG